jgi:glycine cleavage system aminomethyltransferase T
MGWIRSNAPAGAVEKGTVQIRDLTSARAVLNLCGPRARDVLAAVCEDDVSNAAFRYARARELTIGSAPVLALRVGYVGELGWELHIPTEYAAHVYEQLRSAGERVAGPGGHDAHGEGLPVLVHRHHPRHLAVGGRARLAGRSHQGAVLRS